MPAKADIMAQIPGKNAKVDAIFGENAKIIISRRIFISEEFYNLIGNSIVNPEKSGHIQVEFPGPPGGTILCIYIVSSN